MSIFNDLLNKATSERDIIKKELDKLNEQLTKVDAQLKEIEIARIATGQLKEKKDNSSEAIELLQKTIDKKNADLLDAENRFKAVVAERDAIKKSIPEKITVFTKEIEAKTAEILTLQAELNKINTLGTGKDNTLQIVKKDLEQARKRVAEVETLYNTVDSQKRAVDIELVKLKKEFETLKAKVEPDTKKIVELTNTLTQVTSTIQGKDTEIGSLKVSIAQLETQKREELQAATVAAQTEVETLNRNYEKIIKGKDKEIATLTKKLEKIQLQTS